MDIHRAYRILGLTAGAAPSSVQQAYRDLAQVWHPDRFAHSDRLRGKAERNMARINEAYEMLRDYRPPPGGLPRPSRLSLAFDAIRDLGDLIQDRVTTGHARPGATAQGRDHVLGLGDNRPTWERMAMPVTEPRGWRAVGIRVVLWITVVIVVLVLVLML